MYTVGTTASFVYCRSVYLVTIVTVHCTLYNVHCVHVLHVLCTIDQHIYNILYCTLLHYTFTENFVNCRVVDLITIVSCTVHNTPGLLEYRNPARSDFSSNFGHI